MLVRADGVSFPIAIARSTHRSEQTRHAERLRTVCSWFSDWIEGWMKRDAGSGCVVFDIDDTLVDAHEQLVPEVVAILKKCAALKVPCAIVTARPEAGRAYTREMLRARGILMYASSLDMMPDQEDTVTVSDVCKYKSSKRRALHAKHGAVFGTSGDMWWDVVGPARHSAISGRFGPEESAVCMGDEYSMVGIKLPVRPEKIP